MKSFHPSIEEWLRLEAHVVAGEVFTHNDLSCLAVSPEHEEEEVYPVGFLVSQGKLVNYVPADSPEGEEMLETWHIAHRVARANGSPAECYFG